MAYKVNNYPENQTTLRYEGYTKNNVPWGNGSILYRNGEKYTGKFKLGKKSGFGVYTFASHDSAGAKQYIGQFEEDARNGNGTFTW